MYDILTRVSVPAHAAGEETSFYQPYPFFGYPALREDPVTQELAQVRWNNDDRSVMKHLEPSEVVKWYEAIKIWNKFLTSPDSEYWVKLTPGTAVGAYFRLNSELDIPNNKVLQLWIIIGFCMAAQRLMENAGCVGHTLEEMNIVPN